MADKQNGDGTQQQTDGQPLPLDIEALLADEAAANTPVKIADLKPFLEKHTAKLVTSVEADFRKRRDEEAAVERSRHEEDAAAAADIDWAAAIYADLSSSDETKRVAAETAVQQNADRYANGRSLKYQRESTDARDKAISAHVGPLFKHIQDADAKYQPVLDAIADPAKVEAANGNWILTGLRAAEQIGYERGKHEADDDRDLTRRIAAGANGAPAFNNGTPVSSEALMEGITPGKPGSAREYFNRLDKQRSTQQQARR